MLISKFYPPVAVQSVLANKNLAQSITVPQVQALPLYHFCFGPTM